MSIQKKLDKIFEKKEFEKLSEYYEPNSWDPLNDKERESLALLFITHGEHQLQNGDHKGIQNFELATKVDPSNPAVHYRQAFAYAAQKESINCLKEASKALDKTVTLDPNHINAWQSWGNILVDIGIMQENASWLYEADEKFTRVRDLIKAKENVSHDADLLWQWAKCWFHIGKHSGEAVDFLQSLEKFRHADRVGCTNHDFYKDFGNTLADLASLLKRKDLLVEAASHFQKLTHALPSDPQAWLSLGCTFLQLHRHDPLIDYFHQSNDCFSRVMDINPDDSILWHRWAELCVNHGTSTNNIEEIKNSIDKFIKADHIDPQNPDVLLSWAEALIFMASQEENLEYLHEAENKVRLAVTVAPENYQGWYWYGICRSEMGRYFAADSYYRQALEKFQYASKLNPSSTHILYHIGLTHFSIGDLTNETSEIEKCINVFKQCANDNEAITPQFYNDWGIALMKLSEITHDKSHLEEAVTKFDDAIALCAKNSEEVDLEWLYNYGCALDFLGDFHDELIYYEKAIQILSYVVEQDPQEQDARYHLALALFHKGELNSDIDDLHQSINLFHELSQNDPEDEIIWNDYGLVLLNLAVLIEDPGQSEESLHLLEQAEHKLLQASSLGNKYSFYNLACLYSLTNNVQASMQYMERAESNTALPPLAELMNDEWLENLQAEPSFRLFISRLILKHKDSED